MVERKSERIQSKEITTTRELLSKEIVRLQKLRCDKPDWWKNSSDWAREEFGSNLDTITPLSIERNPEYCQICGKKFDLEEKFIRLTFSFCEEYDCEMNLCKDCISEMSREVRNKW